MSVALLSLGTSLCLPRGNKPQVFFRTSRFLLTEHQLYHARSSEHKDRVLVNSEEPLPWLDSFFPKEVAISKALLESSYLELTAPLYFTACGRDPRGLIHV